MTAARAINGLREVAAAYDVYLVDQWGVLHDGHTAHDSAIEVMQRLKDDGKKLIITLKKYEETPIHVLEPDPHTVKKQRQ